MNRYKNIGHNCAYHIESFVKVECYILGSCCVNGSAKGSNLFRKAVCDKKIEIAFKHTKLGRTGAAGADVCAAVSRININYLAFKRLFGIV
jgi:hypothetical protein